MGAHPRTSGQSVRAIRGLPRASSARSKRPSCRCPVPAWKHSGPRRKNTSAWSGSHRVAKACAAQRNTHTGCHTARTHASVVSKQLTRGGGARAHGRTGQRHCQAKAGQFNWPTPSAIAETTLVRGRQHPSASKLKPDTRDGRWPVSRIIFSFRSAALSCDRSSACTLLPLDAAREAALQVKTRKREEEEGRAALHFVSGGQVGFVFRLLRRAH